MRATLESHSLGRYQGPYPGWWESGPLWQQIRVAQWSQDLEQVWRMVGSLNPRVRLQVLDNDSLTPEMVSLLALDSDVEVQEAAEWLLAFERDLP